MYTASGRVCVVPGKFPANVIVAPNSPRARAQHSTAPAKTEGAISGSVTRRNTSHRPAPRVRAASSYRRSIDRSPASTVRTRKGIATNVAARIAPKVVNGTRIPIASSAGPKRPRRPNAKRSATPPTTGGRIIGRVVSARATSRPGNGTRAYTHASGTPSTRARAVAASETTNESRSAVSASVVVRSLSAVCQGALERSPTSGRMKKATATIASAAMRMGGRSGLTAARNQSPRALAAPRAS